MRPIPVRRRTCRLSWSCRSQPARSRRRTVAPEAEACRHSRFAQCHAKCVMHVLWQIAVARLLQHDAVGVQEHGQAVGRCARYFHLVCSSSGTCSPQAAADTMMHERTMSSGGRLHLTCRHHERHLDAGDTMAAKAQGIQSVRKGWRALRGVLFSS